MKSISIKTENILKADINSVNKTDINCGTLHLVTIQNKNDLGLLFFQDHHEDYRNSIATPVGNSQSIQYFIQYDSLR
jgi:hypothetical protein